MKNKTLLIISLIISILGILVLLLIMNLKYENLIEISAINKALLDKNIQIQGEITKIKNQDNLQILTIKDNTGKINAVLYKNTNQKINLNENQTIILHGKIKEYNSQLEIIADKIEII